MDVLLKAHVPAFELDYVNKNDGTHTWQQAFHAPETGFTFFYAWLGNPTELGNMMGVYPFINFHLQRSYKETLYLKVGMGLGYMPVIYDRITNHKNDVIGSHLNAMINLRLNSHIYLSDKLRLEIGLGVTHCSDGNFQTPNLGLNLLTVNTGLSYCIKSYKCLAPHYADTSHKKLENNIFLAGGLSEREPPGQAKYGALTLDYTAYYVINSKNKIGLGVNVFNNNTNIARLADDSIYINWLQNIQLGFAVCYELNIGKLTLPVEMGVYAYSFYKQSSIFNRFGLRYYVNKHIIINLTLLTHFASADYIEWGAGYRF
jgi:hypothetical protein